MKQFFFSIAFLCAMFSSAQTTLKTNSSCDSNTDGKVDITDVTTTVNKVLGKAASDKQVVTAEDLNEVLSEINSKLDKLERLETWAKSISSTVGAMTPEEYEEYEELSKYNNHEYVDLGLSVKWATMNIGATEVTGIKTNYHTGKLDCYGEYYAWGETSLKDSYGWTNYKYCDVKNNNPLFAKYVGSSIYGDVDYKTTLEFNPTCDDVARASWGGTWRMPTYAEQKELLNNCYWEWTVSYNNSGVMGYIVYKVKNDSDKGKMKNNNSSSQTPTASYSLSDTHIFLPAAGYRSGSSFTNVGTEGFYWSSSLYASDSYHAYSIYNYSTGSRVSYDYRYYGQSVRAVCP